MITYVSRLEVETETCAPGLHGFSMGPVAPKAWLWIVSL